VKKWKQQPWWAELVADIQSGEGQKADNKMSKTIDKALDLIMTRMEEGDYLYDQKTCRLVKVPLKARDLERVASGLFDKRQLIRKQPTSIKQSDLNQKDRLLELAEQFAKFAGMKLDKEKVINECIEGDFNEITGVEHAIHDQREEKLQSGAGMGTQAQEESCEG
jgi:hypothetical protein